MKQFGVIGKVLTHSFSPGYFTDKFERLHLPHQYKAYEIPHISELNTLCKKVDFTGLNVTIPFKEEALDFVDVCSEEVRILGALNTIHFTPKGRIGYNTDIIGFESALRTFAPNFKTYRGLVLGTGGASKAVQYVLQKWHIPHVVVSRTPSRDTLGYNDITPAILNTHHLIINTTPLGTFPNSKESPSLPYAALSSDHICMDLVYNPSLTSFMRQAKAYGARVFNGLHMLEGQAEASWTIWNA